VEDGDPAESSVRRSQRRRTVKYYDEVQEEEIEEDSDYEAEEEDFCNSDEGSLGLDSEDEADLSGDPEDEDVVPLSTRLNRMKSIPKEPVSAHRTIMQKNTEPRCDAPAPSPNVPAAQHDQGVKKLGSMHMRHSRLMLPPNSIGVCSNMDKGLSSSGKRAAPSSSDGKRSSWDFDPPGFDIMGSLEVPTPPEEGTSSSHQNQVHYTPPVMINKHNIEPGTYPLFFFFPC